MGLLNEVQNELDVALCQGRKMKGVGGEYGQGEGCEGNMMVKELSVNKYADMAFVYSKRRHTLLIKSWCSKI